MATIKQQIMVKSMVKQISWSATDRTASEMEEQPPETSDNISPRKNYLSHIIYWYLVALLPLSAAISFIWGHLEGGRALLYADSSMCLLPFLLLISTASFKTTNKLLGWLRIIGALTLGITAMIVLLFEERWRTRLDNPVGITYAVVLMLCTGGVVMEAMFLNDMITKLSKSAARRIRGQSFLEDYVDARGVQCDDNSVKGEILKHAGLDKSDRNLGYLMRLHESFNAKIPDEITAIVGQINSNVKYHLHEGVTYYVDQRDARLTTLVLLALPVVVLFELAGQARRKSTPAEGLSRLVVLVGLGFFSIPRIVSVLRRKEVKARELIEGRTRLLTEEALADALAVSPMMLLQALCSCTIVHSLVTPSNSSYLYLGRPGSVEMNPKTWRQLELAGLVRKGNLVMNMMTGQVRAVEVKRGIVRLTGNLTELKPEDEYSDRRVGGTL